MGLLKERYSGLLTIMRKAYGEELTYSSEEFTGRIAGLMCLFERFGVTKEQDFADILGDDWTWGAYSKVVRELQHLGAVDEFRMATPMCSNIAKDMNELYGGK